MSFKIPGSRLLVPRSGEGQTVFYGWVMVAALFLIMFFSLGSWYTFGVFLPYLIDDLETSRALAAGVISVAWIPYGVMGIVAGVLLDKRGPRAVTATGIFIIGLAYLLTSQASAVWHLYLFLGVTLGLGMGVTWVVPTATVSKWFERRRGLALGILLASVGTGDDFATSGPVPNKSLELANGLYCSGLPHLGRSTSVDPSVEAQP